MAAVTKVVHKKPDVESFTVSVSAAEAKSAIDTLEFYGQPDGIKVAKAFRQGLEGKTESDKAFDSLFKRAFVTTTNHPVF